MKNGFSLAEVLITLGIIGVVAAMTLPTLISKQQDLQFKSAYKKAYSDFSEVLQEGLFNQEFTRTTAYETPATTQEFNMIKSKFKIIVDCPSRKHDLTPCWAKGDTVCGGSCGTGNVDDGIDLENGQPSSGASDCFVDTSGRNWCSYSLLENIYVVDTNGKKKPNRFGKDRWLFTVSDANGNRTINSQNYKKVIPFINTDSLTPTSFCKRPPCYYHSWLYK